MMFDWLGDKYKDANCAAAAKLIERAVEMVLKDGRILTPDIGGSSSTTQVAEAVAARLSQVTSTV